MTKTPHILITAGPTHETIDPVRYIANRSSGQMGLALAQAAVNASCDVTLLLGPTALNIPDGISTHRFTTTDDLQKLLTRHFAECDILIMAAAVADYRPAKQLNEKLTRTDCGLTLQLESTPDLIAHCAKQKRDNQSVIGFALETPAQLSTRAKQKLADKQLDAIIANPLSTMGNSKIDATVYTSDGSELTPGPLTKTKFADWLINRIVSQAKIN